MWKYNGVEMGLEGIIGVPAQDLSDEEFDMYNARQNLRHPDQLDSLKTCGLYTHVVDLRVMRRGSSEKEASE